MKNSLIIWRWKINEQMRNQFVNVLICLLKLDMKNIFLLPIRKS